MHKALDIARLSAVHLMLRFMTVHILCSKSTYANQNEIFPVQRESYLLSLVLSVDDVK